MVQIIWLKSAISDLKEIYQYISNDSKRYARQQVHKIQTSTEIIKTHIEIGRVVPELSDRSIREIIVRNYRVIYRIINSQTIHILFIHHSSKELNLRIGL